MKVVRHVFDPVRGVEIVDLEDCHGRKKQIQISVLDFPDPDAFIQQEIAEFERQEKLLRAHTEGRFDPATLERKRDL